MLQPPNYNSFSLFIMERVLTDKKVPSDEIALFTALAYGSGLTSAKIYHEIYELVQSYIKTREDIILTRIQILEEIADLADCQNSYNRAKEDSIIDYLEKHVPQEERLAFVRNLPDL